MSTKRFISFILLLICGSAVYAYQIDLSDSKPLGIESIDFHGVFSQGYIHSKNNNIWAGTKGGTWDFREYGLNVAARVGDDLLLAAQLFGYNLGGLGNDKPMLHYALADYRMTDWLGFRVGQVRMPLGFHNETRDIDMLRTSVFLPQSVYWENYRDAYSSLLGGGLYGNIDMDKFGSLSYQALIGKMAMNYDGAGGVPYYIKPVQFSDDYSKDCVYVLDFKWDTPIEGFRLGYTYRHLEFDASGTVGALLQGSLAVPSGTPNRVMVHNYETNVFSAEYTWDKLVLTGEYLWTTGQGDSDVGPGMITIPVEIMNETGWYLSATYEFTDKFAAGAYYDEYYNNTSQTHQSTLGVFARYIINDWWIVKSQLDYINGSDHLDNPNVNPGGTDNNDILFSVKSTWYF